MNTRDIPTVPTLFGRLASTVVASTVVAITVASTIRAQDLRSGPETGMQLTKVHVYAASGPHKGKEFDAAAKIGQGPGAILFVKALNRETAPIIRSLDALSTEHGLLGFQSFTVFLSGDRTEGEERIRTVSNALNMRNPMTVSLDGAEGPGNYAINRDANLTLVMTKGGVVTECLAFTDTGQKDVPRVKAAIEAVAGKLPATMEERAALLPDDPAKLKKMVGDLWQEVAQLKKQLANQRNRQRNRRQPMRSGDAGRGMRDREEQGRDEKAGQERGKQLPGRIPDDGEMQGLLRRLIRAKTGDEIDAVFAAVDRRVGEDASRRQEMVEGFRRILATTYGVDAARTRAKAYIDKHDTKKNEPAKDGATSRRTPQKVKRSDSQKDR